MNNNTKSTQKTTTNVSLLSFFFFFYNYLQPKSEPWKCYDCTGSAVSDWSIFKVSMIFNF